MKTFNNPYTSPYMPNTTINPVQPYNNVPNNINDIYTKIEAMYNAMQNPNPQPVIISQAQDDFFKSRKYLNKLQECFTGYMLGKYMAEFKISENYKMLDEWANEEFKTFESEYGKKKVEVK